MKELKSSSSVSESPVRPKRAAPPPPIISEASESLFSPRRPAPPPPIVSKVLRETRRLLPAELDMDYKKRGEFSSPASSDSLSSKSTEIPAYEVSINSREIDADSDSLDVDQEYERELLKRRLERLEVIQILGDSESKKAMAENKALQRQIAALKNQISALQSSLSDNRTEASSIDSDVIDRLHRKFEQLSFQTAAPISHSIESFDESDTERELDRSHPDYAIFSELKQINPEKHGFDVLKVKQLWEKDLGLTEDRINLWIRLLKKQQAHVDTFSEKYKEGIKTLKIYLEKAMESCQIVKEELDEIKQKIGDNPQSPIKELFERKMQAWEEANQSWSAVGRKMSHESDRDIPNPDTLLGILDILVKEIKKTEVHQQRQAQPVFAAAASATPNRQEETSDTPFSAKAANAGKPIRPAGAFDFASALKTSKTFAKKSEADYNKEIPKKESAFMAEIAQAIPQVSKTIKIYNTVMPNKSHIAASTHVSLSDKINSERVEPELHDIAISESGYQNRTAYTPVITYTADKCTTHQIMLEGVFMKTFEDLNREESVDNALLKEARALGVLDMLSQFIIKAKEAKPHQAYPSETSKIILTASTTDYARYMAGALLSLGFSREVISVDNLGKPVSLAYKDRANLVFQTNEEMMSAFKSDLGSNADSVLSKVQEYMASKSEANFCPLKLI